MRNANQTSILLPTGAVVYRLLIVGLRDRRRCKCYNYELAHTHTR